MDLGFLSALLGGREKENKNVLTMLLPLLLGGKTSSFVGTEQSDLVEQMFKGVVRDKEEGFPPLFGEKKQGNAFGDSGILNLLGSMNKSHAEPPKRAETKSDYPYELQYNRPDRS